MIAQVMKDIAMDSDFESEWFPIKEEIVGSPGYCRTARSLQINWSGAEGTLNGKITIWAGNDRSAGATGKTIMVEQADNSSDAELLLLYPLFGFLKIKYEKNGITGGLLNVFMNY